MPALRSATCFALLLAAGPAFALGEDPVQLMDQLERRLVAAKRVVIESDIEASGAIQVRLSGRTELDERNRARVEYRGEFAGQPATLTLESDGRALRIGSGATTQALPVEAESNRAILIGLARMGVLHNLARALSLQGPDHAQGGVAQWVALESFRPTTYAVGGELEGLMSFGFDLVVDGKPSGSARIWMDPATGIPKQRTVVVRFAQGDMTVVETYREFRLD